MQYDLQLYGRFSNEWFIANDKSTFNENKTPSKGDSTMNICEERHSPKYKVVYKGVKGSYYSPTWLVCPSCLEHKAGFSDKDEILLVKEIWVSLDNYIC